MEFLSRSDGRGNVLAFLLLAVTGLAWLGVVRADAAMDMAHGPMPFSVGRMVAFTTQWGVMMAAMMLPSAAPMILLYRAISRQAGESSGRVIPAELFSATYVALWLLTGVPVYAASVAVSEVAARSTAFAGAIPFAIAATLFAAGAYQLSPAKRACLRQCEAPHDFLMRRWRGGYAPSLRLAASHAAYCIGCCWALMVVLVAAGAMSLPWVLGISVIVFAEKVLPAGGRTARIAGAGLIIASAAVAIQPDLIGFR